VNLPMMLVLAAIFAALDPLPIDDPPGRPQLEPPVRLKKKARPEAPKSEAKSEPAPAKPASEKQPVPPRKPDETEPAADTEALELEQKLKETMDRLTRNLRQADERLGKEDPGRETQQVMNDIVKDLDELIEATKRQSQQQQQQSSSSSSRKRQQQRDQQRQQNASRQNQQRASQTNQQSAQRTNLPRGRNAAPGEASRIADLYKDIWGHLPETLRQEMNQYSREQFMAKYGDLLKQYYTTLAEKGRRKGE
jgi:hypothetical protein